jgi:Zn-dependent membrane protease YugP
LTSDLLDLLRTWWPVLLLVYAPALVGTVMRIAFSRSLRRLDESHPDDMPLTAGEWLGRELERLGLHGRVRTVVTDDDAKLSLDGYHPFQGVIQLSAETHFKRDPMHWAIAAHELGHARFHVTWPWLGRLTIAALFIKRTFIALALTLVIGNVAFALPHVTDVALVLFAASVALHGFVLGDELIASMYAMDMLRATPGFGPAHVRSARRMLALAFSTYAVGFLARALLLTQWPLVVELTHDPMAPPFATLTTLGTVLAAALSIVLVIAALTRVLAKLVALPDRVLTVGAVALLLTRPALVALLLLVWNTHAGPGFAWWVMLALIPVQGYFVFALMLPMALMDVFVLHRFTRRWVVDVTHRTSQLRRDHEAGRAQRKVGNLAIAELLEKAQASPPLEHRLLQVLHLSYIPLLIAVWLA